MEQKPMTPEQRSLARHALGLPNRRKTTYRNRFVTGKGSKDWSGWDDLVASGYAKAFRKVSVCGGDDIFFLTPEGAKAALDPGEKLSIEDFPQ